MCGRFTQIKSRDDYLEFLLEEAQSNIPYDPEPIGRFNVAPGTKVLLLNNRNNALHLYPVVWSYAPDWWDKPPLINARIVTTAADNGLVDIHDRRPLVFTSDAALKWMNPETTSVQANELAHEAAVPAKEFVWHSVCSAVGNVNNDSNSLIKPISPS